MKTISYVYLLGSVFLISCGNSSKSGSYENNSFGEYSSSESEDAGYEEQVAQMVTCPMCNGTGIFDFMPGDMMAPKQTCGACNGSGMCDANTAQQMRQAQAQIDAIMGGGGSADGYNSG